LFEPGMEKRCDKPFNPELEKQFVENRKLFKKDN